jgi:NAD(P)-dependent dehydrogenase (short-subunit alcohol dehydrogenase family)
MELFNLTGKTAIVTGSARGIGNAIAHRLAQHGANVVVCGLNADKARAAAEVINRKVGAERTIGTAFDLADRAAPEPLIAKAVDRFGGLDILVCNALYLPPNAPLTSTDEDVLNATFDGNVSRNVRLVMLSLPHMQRRGGGSIIYITSTMGFFASPFIGYTVVKAALHHLIHDQALLFGKKNIRVNGIAPGFTDTEAAAYLKENPEHLERLFSELPLARFATPDEMAGAAVFLASPAGAYVTGQTIAVDGGQLLEGTTATRKML